MHIKRLDQLLEELPEDRDSSIVMASGVAGPVDHGAFDRLMRRSVDLPDDDCHLGR